ncbi:phosphate signaling complex protein PhoU [Natrinema thermotolerans]|uniref:Phosphate-specific transport system accessory protein PhoU n=1 Tax=Natrinema thermotolerans TaxID=121872 RepID=A0AAF0T0I0_9EURY|nr:phosphate signaling complex protein PhoU [Natrinema thermotolerans]QCC59851.1 phosphate transport system regulatory protein PhoU [Natrinema thermotolerans]WMT06843.1 phosphate signaling complex protein PhoU [Natrinema thermotolerans]
MTREDYRHRLERLRETVVSMGDLVREQLADGFSALFTSDRDLAREVIERDHAVNDRYLEIERECLDLLALYQPVAGDLRTVVAAFTIVTDLERVGDLATNLAEYTLDATGSDPALPDVDFERIAALALEQLETAVEAFVDEEPAACRAVAERDAELDRRCVAVAERVVRRLIELRRDADDCVGGRSSGAGSGGRPAGPVLADVSRTLVVVRDIERVGDHAVNVAARTLYALENDASLLA